MRPNEPPSFAAGAPRTDHSIAGNVVAFLSACSALSIFNAACIQVLAISSSVFRSSWLRTLLAHLKHSSANSRYSMGEGISVDDWDVMAAPIAIAMPQIRQDSIGTSGAEIRQNRAVRRAVDFKRWQERENHRLGNGMSPPQWRMGRL